MLKSTFSKRKQSRNIYMNILFHRTLQTIFLLQKISANQTSSSSSVDTIKKRKLFVEGEFDALYVTSQGDGLCHLQGPVLEQSGQV